MFPFIHGIHGAGGASPPLDGLVLSAIGWQPPPGPEGLRVYDVDGDTRNDLVFGYGTDVIWLKQSSVWRGTFGRRYPIASGFGDVEGLAVGNVDDSGDAAVAIGDQTNGTLTLAMPTTPGNPTGAWSTVTLVSSHPNLHTVLMFDVDGDGLDEIVFCWEGTSSANAGVAWLDFDGADPMTPGDWTEYSIVSGRRARTLAHFCPADIAGNGRLDLVVCQRQEAGQRGVDWYEMPADPTNPWTRHVIVSDIVATWATMGDFSGDGNGLDIATYDQDSGAPRYYTHASAYASSVSLPDPGLPSLPQQFDAWNIIRIPVDGSRDGIMYATGTGESGSQESRVYLYVYDGGWDYSLVATYDYGHPLESTAAAAAGLITGGADVETVAADSGSSIGGGGVVWLRPYNLTTPVTTTPPAVRSAESNRANHGTTTLTVNKPSGTADGDFLIAFLTIIYGSDVVTPPAGWEPVNQINPAWVGCTVYAKVASGEPASWQWSRSAGFGDWTCTVLAITGADTAAPFGCWSLRHIVSPGSTTARVPTMQAEQAGMLALCMWGWEAGQGGAPTLPAGFTSHSFFAQQRGHTVASKQLSAAGDTGHFDATLDTSSSQRPSTGVLLRGL